MQIESDFRTYLELIFNDLLLRDNGKKSAGISAYTFIKVNNGKVNI